MTRVGPYRILGTIALGGMGEVFLAALQREGGFEKRVALKRARPELTADPAFVELFEREARLAAALDHRNIVQVFDFGRHEGGAWIAMEHVHGVDLKTVLDQEGALPLAVALEIGEACAEGLRYAHQATDARGRALHVVHRDVSPQNVLLSFAGDVKLADFGLAHAAARGPALDGALRGKFAYMSPEQASGREIGPASDQFSLGVLLFEMLSGRRAFFTDEGQSAILRRVCEVRTLCSLEEVGVPPELCAVVGRAMARDPGDRYPDVGALSAALREAQRGLGVGGPTPPRGEWRRGRVPGRAHVNLARVGALTPHESTAAAGAPITAERAAATAESTAAAGAPITGLERTESAYTPAPDPSVPGSRRRRAWPLLVPVGIAIGWLGLHAEPPRGARADATPAQGRRADAGVPTQVLHHQSDAARSPAPDAAPPDATAPDARATDASPADAPAAPRPEAAPAPRARPRPAAPRPRRMAERPPAPVPAPPVATPVVDPLVEPAAEPPPEPAAPAGPRLRVSADGARVTGASGEDGGWVDVPKRGLLLDAKGGAGPPVRLRIRPRTTHFEAAVDARPWGQVILDGRDLGPTPAATVPLRAGKRRLEVRAETGATTTIHLEISP